MPGEEVLAAGVLGGLSAGQGLITSAFNAHEASKNRRFQRNMSDTSHQREVRDLRAAGLNPVLSAKLGGASTPSGATASAESPNVAQSSAQGAALKSQIENTEANTALALAQAGDVNATQQQRLDLMIAQKIATLAQAKKTGGVDTDKLMQEIKNLQSQKALTDLETSHSAYDLRKKKVTTAPWELAGKALDQVQKPGFKERLKGWWNKGKKPTPGWQSGSTGRW